MQSRISTFLLALGLSVAVFAQDDFAAKVSQLRSATGAVERIKLLQDNEFVFDFLHGPPGETDGAAGHTVAASSANFPALIGNGMAMTIGFLGPCGMNTPHTHPRATEFNFVVNGSLQTGFLQENGARFVMNEVPAGSAAIFPKGAIHFEMNNGCEDALFVAAFNDEDPGVNQIAQRFFGLPPAILAATMGDVGIEQIAGLEAKIPDNVALGTDECLKRCGITRGDQPSKQRQPRVSGNALPTGFTAPAAAVATASPTGSSVTSREIHSPTQSISGAVANNDESGKMSPTTIALIALVAVLGAGYVALAIGYVMRRNAEKNARTRGMKYFQTGSEFAPQAPMFENEKALSASRSTPYDPPHGSL